MKTHPADGLYYVTYNMLLNAGACYVAGAIANHFTTDPQFEQIPITLHNVSWLDTMHGGLHWASARMFDRDKVTESEYDSFLSGSGRGRSKAFMDMLLSRAKREGLVR